MEKKNYTIVGITPQLAKRWERDFREDLRIIRNENTKEIQGKISLNIFEAMVMKARIIISNRKNPYVLDIICDKQGKRCRV